MESPGDTKEEWPVEGPCEGRIVPTPPAPVTDIVFCPCCHSRPFTAAPRAVRGPWCCPPERPHTYLLRGNTLSLNLISLPMTPSPLTRPGLEAPP